MSPGDRDPFADDELDDDQRDARLVGLLARAESRRDFVAWCRFESALREELRSVAAARPDAAPRVGRSRRASARATRARQGRWRRLARTALPLAAGLTIVVFACCVAAQRMADRPRVVAGSGSIAQGGSVRAAQIGDQTSAGERISAGADGIALAWRDGTSLTLAAGSRLAIERGPGKRLRLEQDGALLCSAAHQPDAAPLRLATAFGGATVIGTRFRCVVEAGASRLDVLDGRVAFAAGAGISSVTALGAAAADGAIVVGPGEHGLGDANGVSLERDPDAEPSLIARDACDDARWWGPSSHGDSDRLLPFAPTADPRWVRQGAGALRFAFAGSPDVPGLAYCTPPSLAGLARVVFWLRDDGDGRTTLSIRLSQADWGAWDSAPIALAGGGWRRIDLAVDDFAYVSPDLRPDRAALRVLALVVRGAPARFAVDDLRLLRAPSPRGATP